MEAAPAQLGLVRAAGARHALEHFQPHADRGDQIAAAGRAGGSRDASNLVALAGKRGTMGFEGSVQALVTDNAATLKQRRLVAEAQTTIRDGAITTRSELTGVNLDNEAVDLLKYQQAYQASSRVIQVAKETFQSILEIR